jgi:hypothetical protein
LSSIIFMCRLHVILLSKITPRYLTWLTKGIFCPVNVRWASGGLLTMTKSSQSYIATDGQSNSKSWCRAPTFITLTVTVLFFRAPSPTRGQVCLLYMLLVLASVVFLGSESLETRDHILLSQIWDFHFRGLLRLAWSRWRYSNPPPHGFQLSSLIYLGTDQRREPCLQQYLYFARRFVAVETYLFTIVTS